MKKFFTKIKSFFSGIKAEVKKVIWPTPKKLTKNTVTAVAVMLLTAAMLWGFDWVSQLGVKGVLTLIG